MKRKNNIRISFLLITVFFTGTINLFAQDSVKKDLVVKVNYHMVENKMVYLFVNTTTKVERKFDPAANTIVQLYLDEINDANLIAKLKTDEKGNAKAFLPPSLKSAWESSATHKFIAVAEAGKDFDETEGEANIAKTKIAIDTASDAETKSITVNVTALQDNEWVPVNEIELKVGIRRLGGILTAGEELTYTTDSSGSITVEFNKDSLPGDKNGNIVLAAKVEDNDEYGNLLVTKTVPWGIATTADTKFFNQRTLWSTRNRTPGWLLFMAYSIVIGVWGTILYLLGQLLKIKKLSKTSS